MSTSIQISFENRDTAELALSNLRKAGIAFSAAGGTSTSTAMKTPVSPEYCANIFFPFPPAPFVSAGQNNLMNNGYGSRAIVGMDSVGTPLMETGSMRLNITVPNDRAKEARRILHNRGGYDAR